MNRYTIAELSDVFDKISIPFAPVAKPGDLFDDPHLNAGGRMLNVAFPNGENAKIPPLPIEIGSHNIGLRLQAPEIGQHTTEVLREIGVSDADIGKLQLEGVISGPHSAPEKNPPSL